MAWWLVLVLGLLLPYLARIPLSFVRGWDWLLAYLPSVNGVLFFSSFNLLAVLPLTVLAWASASWGTPVAFWVVAALFIIVTLAFHAIYDLSTDAQAAIGLVAVPAFICWGTAALGLIGFFLERWLRGG